MKVHIRSASPGVECVALAGDMDFNSSPEVRRALGALAEKGTSKILVDFAKVGYIDSSGLATFIELFQKMKRSGGALVLYHLSQGVRNVFEIAKLDTVFRLAASEADALALAAS